MTTEQLALASAQNIGKIFFVVLLDPSLSIYIELKTALRIEAAYRIKAAENI